MTCAFCSDDASTLLTVRKGQNSLSNIITPDDTYEFYSYRKISNHSLNEFQASLSYEILEDVFSSNDGDTNTVFNNFL